MQDLGEVLIEQVRLASGLKDVVFCYEGVSIRHRSWEGNTVTRTSLQGD